MAYSNSEWANFANNANALIVFCQVIQSQCLATTYSHSLFVPHHPADDLVRRNQAFFMYSLHSPYSFSEPGTYSKATPTSSPNKRKNVSAEKFSEKNSKFDRIYKGSPFHLSKTLNSASLTLSSQPDGCYGQLGR